MFRFASQSKCWRLLCAAAVFCLSSLAPIAALALPLGQVSLAQTGKPKVTQSFTIGAIKVACVGDSITHGSDLMRREGTTYPDMLGHALGGNFEVRNFGVSGATMLANGNKPWMETPDAALALEWVPDIVVIKLGTNDSKWANWGAHKDDFSADAKKLIQSFRIVNPLARIILCTPLPAWKEGDSINGKRIAEEVIPLVRSVASEEGLEIIDLYTPFTGNKGWFADGVHPNPHGALAVARRVAETVGAKMDWEFRLQSMMRFHSMVINAGMFHGFEEMNFEWAGAKCRMVFPRVTAAGRPWIWRARFWGHEPQFDRAMLERGWHVVYCDVAGLLGGAEAMKRWNSFYDLVTKSGMNAKPFLEGMSRGGLPIYQWAKANPRKVMGIYADNPVIDPKTWSGSANSPHTQGDGWGLQNMDELARFRIPLLHVVGEADTVVPVEPNTNALERLYLIRGGKMKVIRKPGVDHHPHSLKNPQPIVDFALQAAHMAVNPCVLPQPSVEWRGGPAGWGGGTWRDQHEKINALAAENPDLQVVFFGDSITQSWTGSADRLAHVDGTRTFDRYYGKRKAASFGMSGDRTEHLLWRIENGNFDEIDPQLIVLMIGVNNINAGNDGLQVAAGTRELILELRQHEPQAKILLLGSFPTNKEGSWQRQQGDLLHSEIAEYLAGELVNISSPIYRPILGGLEKMVYYYDLRRAFENADGSLNSNTMRGDGVHITGAGYEAWAEAIEPTIRELLGEEVEQEVQPQWLKDAARVKPSPRQLAWQDLELTCFIHFGINTFTDREWGTGAESPSIFAPSALDVEQWVLTAKAAGMKMMLLTAKHHDGFCLWPSRYTPHSVANSPWKDGKGDVVGELAAACKKHGLKMGVYLSPADLNAIERKVYGDGSKPVEGGIPTHAPKYSYALDSYNRYFMNQLYELLTEYGPIDEVWFDGANPKPGTGQTYDRETWYQMIRDLQPQATIAIDGPDVRWIGNEGGHARAGGEWSVVPMNAPENDEQIRVKLVKGETHADLGSRAALKEALDHGAVLRWFPAEMNTSIRGGWFYHAHEDGHPKASVERLMHLFDTGYGGNAVLLLNVSPDRRGLIHEADAERLAQFGRLVQQSFATNKATSKMHTQDPEFLPAIDGDPETWWQPAEGINRASLEINLSKLELVNLIELREAISQGQRIEKFFVEGWNGTAWVWLCEGNAVGNRALRRIAPIEISKLRLHITSSRLCPTINEIGLYLAPTVLKAPTISKQPGGLIAIDAQPGTEIRYTVNGANPSAKSALYTGPLDLSALAAAAQLDSPDQLITNLTVRARCIEPLKPENLGTVANAHFDLRKAKWRIHGVSSEQADSGEGAAAAIDGDPKTLWHSQWQPTAPTHPHWLTIDFGEQITVNGFVYTPRSDANRNGTILGYKVELSRDGEAWEVAQEADFQNMVNNPTQRRVNFSRSYDARYMRLTALTEVTGQPWASAAEIDVVGAK
ncbi:MAG: alpha-L-fucosidase [Planctomycetes bacterium]|nr:alpha-L-fucosidase [Planctomycetota bacterium]